MSGLLLHLCCLHASFRGSFDRLNQTLLKITLGLSALACSWTQASYYQTLIKGRKECERNYATRSSFAQDCWTGLAMAVCRSRSL